MRISASLLVLLLSSSATLVRAEKELFLSDAPSDVPSDVPSMVPTEQPPPSEICNICGNDQAVGSPETIMSNGSISISCGELEVLGLAGKLDSEACANSQLGASLFCQCRSIEEAGEATAIPTSAPLPPLDVAPNDCNARTCTQFDTLWDLRQQAQSASSASIRQICACAFDYNMDNGKCSASRTIVAKGETTIFVQRGQELTITCAADQVCMYACPDTFLDIESGGAGQLQNVIATGGSQFTRIFVGNGGLFFGKNLNISK